MKKVAIIGTVGVPAKYGGYETLVENLLDKKINAEIQYLVYCSSNVYKEKFHLLDIGSLNSKDSREQN